MGRCASEHEFVHSTAVGNPCWPSCDDERNQILERLTLPPLTKNTLTDREEFCKRLEKIRARGYAVDDEENEVGIRCVGAPLFDHVARVAGAVSVSGWTITMTHERLPELAPILQDTCRAISKELGYQLGD
jgi:IclR family acetate operon transcriptional repressor